VSLSPNKSHSKPSLHFVLRVSFSPGELEINFPLKQKWMQQRMSSRLSLENDDESTTAALLITTWLEFVYVIKCYPNLCNFCEAWKMLGWCVRFTFLLSPELCLRRKKLPCFSLITNYVCIIWVVSLLDPLLTILNIYFNLTITVSYSNWLIKD